MRARYATKAYSSADLSSKTQTSSPEELIVLLCDKACSSLRRASMLPMTQVHDLELEDRLSTIEDFHSSTSKALQIVIALRGLLDMEQGGELSSQLFDTYTVIAGNIWSATKAKDCDALSKLVAALSEIRDAWREVANTNTGSSLAKSNAETIALQKTP
jgi:flagellar protein FliS